MTVDYSAPPGAARCIAEPLSFGKVPEWKAVELKYTRRIK